MRKQFHHTYEDTISLENLLLAWREFARGKREKKDVQEFDAKLMENLLILHEDLKDKIYIHGSYQAFNISDPKPRNIHKATVRDRLLHHALYRQLYPFFDRTFIADSYSCRNNKGIHKALERFKAFNQKASRNNTKTVWILKCDVKKFFASIDQKTLLVIIRQYISDQNIMWLLEKVVESFYSIEKGKGLPLGNLTSQLLVNVYMNEFDQFVKHRIKHKYYIRYADDFVMMHLEKTILIEILPRVQEFLEERLKLKLHPDKIFLQTTASGVDFLGWVHFPHHQVLRTSTKRRMFRHVSEKNLFSYLGLCKHGNTFKLIRKVMVYLKYG